MESRHLKYLINEEIYVIKEDAQEFNSVSEPEQTQSIPVEKPTPESSPQPEVTVEQKPTPESNQDEKPVLDSPSTDSTTAEVQSNSDTKKPLTIDGKADSIVLIVNNDPGETFIKETNRQFLEKILKAVNLNLTNIALINEAATPLSLKDIQNQTKAKTVLVFGNTQIPEFLSVAKYKILKGSTLEVLIADPLSEIANDVEKKKALWANLQQLFL